MSIFDTMTEAQELLFLKQVSANMRAMDHPKLASPTSTDPQNKPKPEALQRLHEKINDNGRWTGGTNSDGYPKVRINQQSELASHVLLKEKGITLRPGQVVMHKDNDPLNLKPDNLAVGTQKMNLKQMRDEGRDRPRGVDQEPDVKTAAPRWTKVIRDNLGTNDGLAHAVGSMADKMQFKPRVVKNLSMGGQEAAVDLMAGRMPSATGVGPGLFARKLYKPDSLVARGAHNTDLLAEKKIMTDTARGLSSEAKATVPQFHGFQELHSGTDKVRHISDHEFVPNARHVDRELQGLAAVQHVNRTVVDPLERKGMAMRDLPRTLEGTHTVDPKSNLGNVMQTADGQLKIMDFMPQNPSTPVHMSKNTVMSPYIDKNTYRDAKGNPTSSYTHQSINTLRKEVYRPQTAYPVSEYRPSPPTSSMARQPTVSQGGPASSTPITAAAPLPTRAAPTGSTPITAVDKPSGIRLRQGQATPATQAASPLRPTPVTAVA